MSTKKNQLSEEFFRSLDDASAMLRLFDFVPDVFVYVKNVDGQFVAGNQHWFKIRGAASADELIGKTDVDLHPLYWARQYQEEDRRVIESGQELPEQIWLVPSGDGKMSTLVSTKIPLFDKRGRVIGIAGVMVPSERTQPTSTRSDPITLATELIAKRFGESITVAKIAEAVDLSVSQLNRRFRAKLQIPPSEYLQRVRVYEASRLLAESEMKISDIALDVGFFDQAHLTRIFGKWMGMTPNEFRKSMK